MTDGCSNNIEPVQIDINMDDYFYYSGVRAAFAAFLRASYAEYSDGPFSQTSRPLRLSALRAAPT
jgi:hypothetical protein